MKLFDFYSGSFNLVMGLFAAIFGMAFPLILQSVQRIDEKYDSLCTSKNFKSEYEYKVFCVLLPIYVFFVCVLPLVLGYFQINETWSYVIHCVMAIFLLVLAIILMLLFRKMSIYYDAASLVSKDYIRRGENTILSIGIWQNTLRKEVIQTYTIKPFKRLARFI